MALVRNKEFIQAMLKDPKTSQTVKTALKDVNLDDMELVFNTLTEMDDVRNAWISDLVNRCVSTRFFQKVYENPLKMLHHGMLGFGDSIQQIFVKMGQRKGFYTNFDDSNGSPEKDLIGKRVPDVEVDIIKQNFAHRYKVSVSIEELRKAFMNEGGLQSMASGLINSNMDSAETDEFEDMKGLLIRKDVETKPITDPTNKEGHKYEKGVVYQVLEGDLKNKAVRRLGKSYTPSMICETVREVAGTMRFKTDKYNLAQVKTFSRKEELVFVTTPQISAKIDVQVLAQAFNVSSADVNIRTIEIDELPTVGNETVLGIVMDKWLIQAFDMINMAEQFKNGAGLYVNYFLHKQGIMALCKFAQVCLITDGEGDIE